MINKHPRVLAVAVTCSLSVLAVSACAAPTAPPPPDSSASAQAPAVQAPPARSFPARPREVRFAGVEPCSLVTPQLRARLHGLNDHFSHQEVFDSLTSTNCSVTNTPLSPSYYLGIRLVTSQGADADLSAPQATVTTINGFGALNRPGTFDATKSNGCLTEVDVAPGQSLWVGFGTIDNSTPPGGYQAMCSKSNEAAESVLQQLLAKSP